jgi:hypothetical protein
MLQITFTSCRATAEHLLSQLLVQSRFSRESQNDILTQSHAERGETTASALAATAGILIGWKRSLKGVAGTGIRGDSYIGDINTSVEFAAEAIAVLPGAVRSLDAKFFRHSEIGIFLARSEQVSGFFPADLY